MIILGLDVGQKRIGMAVSDPMGILATGLPTLIRTDIQSDFNVIKNVIMNRKVECIILGLPVHMNGQLGIEAKNVGIFREELEKVVQIPIEMIDERLTTVSAERILLEADLSRKKRKLKIDQVAAQIILQSYLERKRSGS